MASRKRLKLDWYGATEGSNAHAFAHKPNGLSDYSMCGLPIDKSWLRKTHPKCPACDYAIQRNFR